MFSDHSLICREEEHFHEIGDNMGVNVGVMKKLGYTVMQKDENGNDIPSMTGSIQKLSSSDPTVSLLT